MAITIRDLPYSSVKNQSIKTLIEYIKTLERLSQLFLDRFN
jgi:hypothetical protein